MRYEVTGASRSDGRDVVRVYEARDEDEATRLANADGIVVDGVDVLIEFQRPVATVATPAAAPATAAATPARATPAVAPPAVVADYRGPDVAGTPSYRGLAVAGAVLWWYAMLCYVAGGLVLLVVLPTIGTYAYNIFSRVPQASVLNLIGIVITSLLPTFGLLFAGAVSHGLSAACGALRDIARNSWR